MKEMTIYGLDMVAEHITFQSFKKTKHYSLIITPKFDILDMVRRKIEDHIKVIDEKAIIKLTQRNIEFLNGSAIYLHTALEENKGWRGHTYNIAVNIFGCIDKEFKWAILPTLAQDLNNEFINVYE